MSDRDYLYGHVCRHGSLARSCQVCDLQAEVRQLRAERTAMLDAIEAAEAYVETPPPARTIGQAEDLCGFLDRVLDLIGDDRV